MILIPESLSLCAPSESLHFRLFRNLETKYVAPPPFLFEYQIHIHARRGPSELGSGIERVVYICQILALSSSELAGGKRKSEIAQRLEKFTAVSLVSKQAQNIFALEDWKSLKLPLGSRNGFGPDPQSQFRSNYHQGNCPRFLPHSQSKASELAKIWMKVENLG